MGLSLKEDRLASVLENHVGEGVAFGDLLRDLDDPTTYRKMTRKLAIRWPPMEPR